MAWLDNRLLSITVLLPLIWAIAGACLPARSLGGQRLVRGWALTGSILTLALSVLVFQRFNAGEPGFQLAENLEWLPALGIGYRLGIDGISLWLFLLTTALMPLAILASFRAIDSRVKEYYLLLLALETAMLGAFVALDVFLFYVFWEAMLIPMYFLVGIWGGKDRVYAAMKFFLYTLVGSLLMLVAIFYLAFEHHVQFGAYSMYLPDLMKLQLPAGGWLSVQSLLFLAFAVAFAVKVPLFPLHTWLPDAHVQAPTAGSVILAAILLKMGGYGFLRLAFPLFPEAVVQYQVPFLILGSIAIVYGAWVAMVQPDIKKLVAYSSVSHMGYVVLGLFSLNLIGASGALYQMLAHGVSTGALFLLVGMIYERRHTREISEFGGVAKVMPLFTVAFMIVTLSSVALPGTNGFVGEFMILLGTWKASRGLAVVGATGVIFGAVYMLWVFQRVMFGPITNPENRGLRDLSLREIVVLIPFIVAIFGMGLLPGRFLDHMNPALERVLARVAAGSAPAPAVAAVSPAEVLAHE